jgi:hypothetical protein
MQVAVTFQTQIQTGAKKNCAAGIPERFDYWTWCSSVAAINTWAVLMAA